MVVGKSQVSSDFYFFLIVLFSLVMSYFELYLLTGFSGGSDNKESACNAGDLGFIPGVGRKWQPTPVSLPGEFHGQRLQSMGLKRIRHD